MTNKLDFSAIHTTKTSDWIGFILLPIGILILSLAAIFIRFSENELGPFATIFNRFWIGIVTLLVWKTFCKIRYKTIYGVSIEAETYTKKDIILGVSCGFTSATCLITWAWSLTQTSVANSNLLHNLTPFFATLGGWLFLGKYFENRFLIGLILALTGAISIGIEDLHISSQHLIGDAVALLSALFYGASYLVREKLREKFSATTVLLWLCGVGILVAYPLTLLTEDQLFPTSVNSWLTVIALGVICQVIGQGIMTYSLKQFSAGFVSLFLLLEPIFTALLAWIIFTEKLSFLNWVAFFVVLTGIYLAKSSQGVKKNNELSAMPSYTELQIPKLLSFPKKITDKKTLLGAEDKAIK